MSVWGLTRGFCIYETSPSADQPRGLMSGGGAIAPTLECAQEEAKTKAGQCRGSPARVDEPPHDGDLLGGGDGDVADVGEGVLPRHPGGHGWGRPQEREMAGDLAAPKEAHLMQGNHREMTDHCFGMAEDLFGTLPFDCNLVLATLRGPVPSKCSLRSPCCGVPTSSGQIPTVPAPSCLQSHEGDLDHPHWFNVKPCLLPHRVAGRISIPTTFFSRSQSPLSMELQETMLC